MALETLNLRQVQDAMREFAEKDVRNISLKAIRKTAHRLKNRVKQEVPVEQGELKNSIYVTARKNKRTKEPYGIVKTRIGYYNTLLYKYREPYVKKTNGAQVQGHEIYNPTGNWYDNTVSKYGEESVQLINKNLKDGIREAAAKTYTKTLVRAAKAGK